MRRLGLLLALWPLLALGSASDDTERAAYELRRVGHDTPNAEVLEHVRRAVDLIEKVQKELEDQNRDLLRRVEELERKEGR